MRMNRAPRKETWEQVRRRLIADTSRFLSERLERPELAVSIPAIPAGMGRFPKSMAGAFWRSVLFE
ncbi:MAG: hypothetical protein IID33_09345 [Planctomycetes bacterium]|nr:hypothetical protein [Planctomycetota bacterium]